MTDTLRSMACLVDFYMLVFLHHDKIKMSNLFLFLLSTIVAVNASPSFHHDHTLQQTCFSFVEVEERHLHPKKLFHYFLLSNTPGGMGYAHLLPDNECNHQYLHHHSGK